MIIREMGVRCEWGVQVIGVCNRGKVGVGMQWGLEGLQRGEMGVSGGNGGLEHLLRGGRGGQDANGGAGRVTLEKMGG